ncbi:MAG: sugar phosphate isomerase/epimerase family protein [Planctomycetia bacterium]|nr:sugar phosphate isomerase/epimerase family protein [Planctomycetia bacterium]
MSNSWSRREFLKTSAALGSALPLLGAGLAPSAQAAEKKVYKTKLYKSCSLRVKTAKVIIEEAAKCGYDGVETWDWDIERAQALEVRAIAKANGLRVQSATRGWARFNMPEAQNEDIETVKKALRNAAAYGADALLLVPCRIAEKGVLPACNFKIDFDPKTCMIRSVVDGDNAPYQEYIRLHNESTKATIACVEKLIPTAEAEGVVIALENVWNNLWVLPELAAALIRSFNNKWVKGYLDLGNNCKYAPVPRWVKAFGKDLIAKMHIKDFLINTERNNGGDFVPIGQGSIDWIAVRDALEEAGVDGFISTEDVPHYSLAEHVKIMDLFIEGRLTKEAANAVKPFEFKK